MAIISRTCPGWVRQTLENSCWAAVLESWSRADPRMMRLRQQSLIATWGEGPTGGITPVTKIPQIAAAYNLQWGGFRSGNSPASSQTTWPQATSSVPTPFQAGPTLCSSTVFAITT